MFPMGVDAKGIDLGDTALAYLTFERVDLEDAYFDGAQIVRCNLEEANLAGCKFWGALLVRSDLSGARLDGADFGGAYLFSNQFNGATLTGASFSGAPLLTSTSGFGRHIALPGNDFSDVEGITLAEIEMASKRPERRQSRTNIAQLRSASRTLNETPISSPAQGGLRAVR